MTTAARDKQPLMRHFTGEDFDSFSDDGNCNEIIGEQRIVSLSPTNRQLRVSFKKSPKNRTSKGSTTNQ